MGKSIKVNFRIDEDLKKEVDELAKKLHMTFSGLMNVYAAQLVREQRIPFEISALPPGKTDNAVEETDDDPFDDEIIGDGVSASQMKNWLKKS